MSRVATGLRSPRPATHEAVLHRHFRLDGRGYIEHDHGVVTCAHEHMRTGLGRVFLVWADRESSQAEHDGGSLVGFLVFGIVGFVFVASVWPW